MTGFKLRPLHRQRRRRHATVRVLDHAELAAEFRVAEDELKAALDAAGWRYHEDANGRLWASVTEVPPDRKTP